MLFSEQWDQLQQEFSCCGMTGPLDFESYWPQSCCPSEGTIFTTTISFMSNVSDSRNDNVTNKGESCKDPHSQGCEEHLMTWLKKTADLLFVLGFCVIAFTKLCFLGILRYEIREMIQKIRLLKEPPPPTVPFVQSFCTGLPPPPSSQQQQQLLDIPINNGSIARRTTLPIVAAHSKSSKLPPVNSVIKIFFYFFNHFDSKR
jgi:hypothetical protein